MSDPKTCKTCNYFNFKVSAIHAWGECLKPEVINSQKISLSLVNEVFEHPEPTRLKEAIKNYGRILYREDTFGCMYHSEFQELSPCGPGTFGG